MTQPPSSPSATASPDQLKIDMIRALAAPTAPEDKNLDCLAYAIWHAPHQHLCVFLPPAPQQVWKDEFGALMAEKPNLAISQLERMHHLTPREAQALNRNLPQAAIRHATRELDQAINQVTALPGIEPLPGLDRDQSLQFTRIAARVGAVEMIVNDRLFTALPEKRMAQLVDYFGPSQDDRMQMYDLQAGIATKNPRAATQVANSIAGAIRSSTTDTSIGDRLAAATSRHMIQEINGAVMDAVNIRREAAGRTQVNTERTL